MNPTRTRRRALVIGLALLAVAGTGVGLAVRRGGPGSDSGARGADLAQVLKTSFDISTTASGELQARNQIEIRSELDTEASILEIAAEGARVKIGDLLVRLNGEDIQLK